MRGGLQARPYRPLRQVPHCHVIDAVVGVAVYDALKDAGPLASPQDAEPVRVAFTATVAVKVVAASLSVPVLPVA